MFSSTSATHNMYISYDLSTNLHRSYGYIYHKVRILNVHPISVGNFSNILKWLIKTFL